MEQKIKILSALPEFKPKTSYCFISKGRVINIPFADIRYITKRRNKIIIFTITSRFPTYHRLHEVLSDLPVNDFLRISRGVIISLRFLTLYRNSCIIAGNKVVNITKMYRKSIITHLASILNQQYQFYESHEPNRPVIQQYP